MQDREHFIFNLLLVMTFLYVNEKFNFIGVDLKAFAVTLGGFLTATLFFGPDLDTNSKSFKRWGLFSIFWLPYKWSFRHGQSSHGVVTGFASRMIYVFVLIGVALVAIKIRYDVPWGVREILTVLKTNGKMIALFLAGVFLSNLGHIIGDAVTKG